MNITDKNIIVFISKFKRLKNKTNNFSKISYKIILEDPSSIIMFRTIAGMTTNLFSRSIGLPYSWIYNVEHLKSKIGVKGTQNLSNKISKLFNKNNYNLDIEYIKRNYISLNNIKIDNRITKDLNNLANANFEEFLKFFKKLKAITYNFSQIYNILLEDSRVMIVFRLMQGLSQKQFAKKLNISFGTMRELEVGYRKIKLPRTAKEYAKRIEKLIKHSVETKRLEKNFISWKNTRKIKENKEYNWNTIRYTNAKDFENYINEIRKETNDFSFISPDLLQRSPQLIMVFRILLGLTQRELGRKVGLKYNYISNYEALRNKTLSRGRAELLLEYFKNQIELKGLQKLTNDELINNFLETKEAMFTHNNSNVTIIKSFKTTEQEKSILKTLESINFKGIGVYQNYNLFTNKGTINVDFLIKLNDEPKIIIECTSLHGINKKFSYNLKRKIYEIDYRFTKIKNNYPKIRTLFILSLYDDDLVKYRVKKLIKSQTLSINDTFINDELKNLQKTIMEDLNIRL